MKKFIIFIFCVVCCITYPIFVTYKEYQFNKNCEEWLKLAADANNIPIAKARLDKAISYLEKENITQGYTSLWFQTPDTSITEWYTNLKATQRNLENFKLDVTESDINNTLMKLRETLLDRGDHGDRVTLPPFIQYAPHNLLLFIVSIVFCLMLLIIFIIFLSVMMP